MRNTVPLISFSFDDFPRSAFLNGGRILVDFGVRGTYYVSMGLAGTRSPTGEIFHLSDLDGVRSGGHEIGCHTFHHCHAWETEPAAFEESIVRNAAALRTIMPDLQMQTLSYPIGNPRPATKRLAAKHFLACRAGGQVFNQQSCDLNGLRAFFLEQSRNDFDGVKRVIDAACDAHGWLIFATHDVCDSPTRFGCTSEFFEQVVDHSAQSGARLLPVGAALKLIQ